LTGRLNVRSRRSWVTSCLKTLIQIFFLSFALIVGKRAQLQLLR
jgi:hypothetical protein